jgi:hypothetical protein
LLLLPSLMYLSISASRRVRSFRGSPVFCNLGSPALSMEASPSSAEGNR